MAPEWIWNQNGEDTMHPFWAVRRLTAQQLARAKLEVQPGRSIPRFNCELVIRSISSVCVGAMDGHSLNRTRIFEVPFLTNSEEVMQGEELILEILEQRKELPKASKRRSWRDALKEEEKAALKDGETKKRRDAVADD
jgi:hypothetical protein